MQLSCERISFNIKAWTQQHFSKNTRSVAHKAGVADLQGFLVGSDSGTLFLFEREGEGVARTYRKTKTLAVEGQAVKIRNLAVSPSEDTLLCTLENNQMYSLNLTNTEVMKVRPC